MYGFVRATGDLDIFVENSDENARHLITALADFGFGDQSEALATIREPGRTIRFGVPPLRIGILNKISGVEFDLCYENRVVEKVGKIEVPFIDLGDLITNKKASGRPKDIADVAELSKQADLE